MAVMTKKTASKPAIKPLFAPVLAALGHQPAMAIAACAMTLTTGNEVQLTPAGSFRGMDGRPKDAEHWYIDAEIAQALIAAADARRTSYVTDYDHQTLRAEKNGQPAPAAGWFKKLEWREGVGLFAIDVDWTERARTMIAAGEYKYISPVFLYEKVTGKITALYMAAITNNPAIDGMDEVLLAAASRQFASPQTASLSKEIPSMEELLEQLRWLLNLPVGATAEDILAQLEKLTKAVKEAVPDQAAAANFDLLGHLESQRQAMASLSAQMPDPAKYVPIAVMQDMQTQIVALSSQLNADKVDDLVKTALDEGKLLPSQETWAQNLGKSNFAALTAYLDTAQPIAVLTGTQTHGNPPKQAQTGAVTENQAALCRAMGISEEDFLKTRQGDPQV